MDLKRVRLQYLDNLIIVHEYFLILKNLDQQFGPSVGTTKFVRNFR